MWKSALLVLFLASLIYSLRKVVKKYMYPAGLNYSLSHLIAVKDEVSEMTLEEQARYADNVLRGHLHDPAFMEQQMADRDHQYDRWNTTSVGNCAYIALHAPIEEHRKK